MVVLAIFLIMVVLAAAFLKDPKGVGSKIIYIVLTFVMFYIGLMILDVFFSFLPGILAFIALVFLFIFAAGFASEIASKITRACW